MDVHISLLLSSFFSAYSPRGGFAGRAFGFFRDEAGRCVLSGAGFVLRSGRNFRVSGPFCNTATGFFPWLYCEK
jgi:hypothetical protein